MGTDHPNGDDRPEKAGDDAPRLVIDPATAAAMRTMSDNITRWQTQQVASLQPLLESIARTQAQMQQDIAPVAAALAQASAAVIAQMGGVVSVSAVRHARRIAEQAVEAAAVGDAAVDEVLGDTEEDVDEDDEEADRPATVGDLMAMIESLTATAGAPGTKMDLNTRVSLANGIMRLAVYMFGITSYVTSPDVREALRQYAAVLFVWARQLLGG